MRLNLHSKMRRANQRPSGKGGAPFPLTLSARPGVAALFVKAPSPLFPHPSREAGSVVSRFPSLPQSKIRNSRTKNGSALNHSYP
jgi:hypothetical protein